MKTNRAAVALLSILFTTAILGYASPQKTDPEFTAFLTKFRAAITKNDKNAIASMTKLPFLFDSKERNREEFIQIYPQLFTPKIRRCLAKAKPLKDGEVYDVFCGELIFLFGKDAGEYKFLEFGVND